MEYTITDQKIVSIITDGIDADGLPIWHAEEDASGDKTEVTLQTEAGEEMRIYVDSIDPSGVESEVELLMSNQ